MGGKRGWVFQSRCFIVGPRHLSLRHWVGGTTVCGGPALRRGQVQYHSRADGEKKVGLSFQVDPAQNLYLGQSSGKVKVNVDANTPRVLVGL